MSSSPSSSSASLLSLSSSLSASSFRKSSENSDGESSDEDDLMDSAFSSFLTSGIGSAESDEKAEGERDEDALQAELLNAAQMWSHAQLLPGGPLLPGMHIATLKWHSLSQISQMMREVGNCSLCDSSSYEQVHIEQKKCIHQSDHHLGFKTDVYVLQQRSLSKERKYSYLADGKSVSHVLEAKYCANMASCAALQDSPSTTSVAGQSSTSTFEGTELSIFFCYSCSVSMHTENIHKVTFNVTMF